MPHKYEKPPGTRNYQNYTEETLEKAAFLVKTNKFTKSSSRIWNIQINNRQQSEREAPETRLTEETENMLVNVIDTFTAWKMPLAKIDVRLLVQDYLDRKTDGKKVFKGNLPGPDWIDGFVARHRLTEHVDNVKV